MLTNPVTPTSAAQTDGDRPTLRIAARAAVVAEDASLTTAERITQDVSGSHAQWRSTLETVRATVANLEQACEAAIDAQQAETAGLIDRLVQNAAAEATTAARVLERAQNENSELRQGSMVLQATVEKLQAALSHEQENVKRLSAELCSTLQQLDVAVAERSKLTNTFRLVQRALALNPPESVADATDTAPHTAASHAEPDPHHRPADLSVASETLARIVQAVADPHSAAIEAPVEAVEDVGRVLAQIEVLYLEDVKSGRSGIELVDRLTASIRHARSVIVSRWSVGDFDPQELFEHQMGLLLGREAASSFARHLSIAAYSARTPDAPSAPEASGAAGENTA